MEYVISRDLSIQLRRYRIVVGVVALQGLTESHMHMAFLAGDTHGDALHILMLGLLVTATEALLVKLSRFGRVAGVPLIRDRHRHYVELVKIVRKGFVFGAIQGQHTHHRRVGFIHSVFGPALSLGDPDRKSTRLNSSHVAISYAVFCLKKK